MNESNSSASWDVVVIGGGAAGLSAALMLGRARRRVLVVDEGRPRNRFASHMHGVLGNESASPADLLGRGRAEASAYGVQFFAGVAQDVAATDDAVSVRMGDGSAHTARAVIVATGITDALPEIPGLAERWGKTVLHCPYCHGWEVRDQRLGVLATSPAALHQARLVRQWSNDVTLFSAGVGEVDAESRDRLSARGVRIVESPVLEVIGEGELISAVRTEDGSEIAVDALFTAGAPVPHDGFLASLGLVRTELPLGLGTFIEVDAMGRTSHPRIWAIGNVVNPMANVPMAVGAGAFTGGAVNGALVEEDFALALEQQRL